LPPAQAFHYVPNTFVHWRHAVTGGIFVALGIELAKKLLSVYLATMPTYSLVYGTFATLPIFLVWIYLTWVIVLLGAVIAAYLPSLLAGVERRGSAHGWQFQLAVEVMQQLHKARGDTSKGLTLTQLTQRMRVDTLQLEPVLGVLASLDWIGQIQEVSGVEESRFMFMAEPKATPLEPLMQQLLLDKAEAVKGLWEKAQWSQLRLSDVL
jgi:membrane protein